VGGGIASAERFLIKVSDQMRLSMKSTARDRVVFHREYGIFFKIEERVWFILEKTTPRPWSLIGGHGVLGSWDNPDIRAVRCAVKLGAYLYCGAYGEKLGSAQIWKFDGSNWEMVYSAAACKQSFNRINAIECWDGRIAAGLGTWGQPGKATVLLLEPNLGANGLEFFPIHVGATEVVDSLCVWQNHLVAGLSAGNYNATLEASVVIGDGSTWKTLRLPATYTGIYALATHNGSVYAGTWNRNHQKQNDVGARVLKLTKQGWHSIESGNFASQIMNKSAMVMSLTTTPNGLYGTLSLSETNTAFQTPIFKITDDYIESVNLLTTDETITKSGNFNHSIFHNGNFYFTSAGAVDGRGGIRLRVWRLMDDGNCIAIGGGHHGGWRDSDIGSANPRYSAWIYKLVSFEGSLLAFIAYGIGGGQATVWKIENSCL
jgi:hypothetical protein